MSEEGALQVARCTKIIKAPPPTEEQAAARTAAAAAAGGTAPPPNADEQDKYVINVKQIAKFVVALGDKVSPTDIEEGMRVGCVITSCVETKRGLYVRTALPVTSTRFRCPCRPGLIRR